LKQQVHGTKIQKKMKSVLRHTLKFFNMQWHTLWWIQWSYWQYLENIINTLCLKEKLTIYIDLVIRCHIGFCNCLLIDVVVGIFSASVFPMLRAMMSRLCTPDEQGKKWKKI